MEAVIWSFLGENEITAIVYDYWAVLWVNDLKNGKEHILLQEKSKTKLIAPLFAQVGCVKCHDTYSTGDFMGAFVYDFVLPVVNEFPKTKL